MRIVPLDSEGNPVGTGEVFDFSRFDMAYVQYPSRNHFADQRMSEYLETKTVTLKNFTASNELLKLLMGEDGNTSTAPDSDADPVGREEDGGLA